MEADRRRFRRLVRETLAESEDEEQSEDLGLMNTERFNDNDEELVAYVREFKARVRVGDQIEGEYIKSDTNKRFVFPRASNYHDDSETSIRSLEAVKYYDLAQQNDDLPLQDCEKLAVVIREAGKQLPHQLSHQLR